MKKLLLILTIFLTSGICFSQTLNTGATGSSNYFTGLMYLLGNQTGNPGATSCWVFRDTVTGQFYTNKKIPISMVSGAITDTTNLQRDTDTTTFDATKRNLLDSSAKARQYTYTVQQQHKADSILKNDSIAKKINITDSLFLFSTQARTIKQLQDSLIALRLLVKSKTQFTIDTTNKWLWNGATNTSGYIATLYGGSSSGGNSYQSTTSHATKGKHYFNSDQTTVFDEANNYFGIGDNTPSASLNINNGNILFNTNSNAIQWGNANNQITYSGSTGYFVFNNTAYYMGNAVAKPTIGIGAKSTSNIGGISIDAESTRYISMATNGTANTAGNSLIISGSEAGITSSRKNGGFIYIRPGLGYGSGYSSISFQRTKRVAYTSTQTVKNTLMDAQIILSEKTLLDATNDTLFSFTFPTGADSLQSASFFIPYGVQVYKSATGHQSEGGHFLINAIKYNGVVTYDFTSPTNTQKLSGASTLTSTLTLSPTTGSPATVYVIVNFDSSLDPTADNMKIYGTIFNNSRCTVTQY